MSNPTTKISAAAASAAIEKFRAFLATHYVLVRKTDLVEAIDFMTLFHGDTSALRKALNQQMTKETVS